MTLTWRHARWAASAIAAIVAATAAVGVSAGQIWAHDAPALARRFWPSSASAEAEQASQALVDLNGGRPARARALQLARAAIARNPGNVVAIRTRGLLADLDGDPISGRRWMTQAEALSRRDLPTQLWFIEDAVRRGDVGGALVHYDRALRTSRNAPDLLFPVLIGATAQPAVADKLSRLLAGRPIWWAPFMNRMIGEAPDPHVLIAFTRRLRLSPADPAHPDFFPRVLQRLVGVGDFAKADQLYREAAPPDRALLHDGGFERDDPVLPFGWRLADDAELGARIEARPDRKSGRALVLDARNGRTGEVASQAVALTPGRYALSGVAAQVGVGGAPRPSLIVRCGMPTGDLASFTLEPAGDRPRSFSLSFVVPGNCRGVWITAVARSGLDAVDAASPWLDDLVVTRITTEGA